MGVSPPLLARQFVALPLRGRCRLHSRCEENTVMVPYHQKTSPIHPGPVRLRTVIRTLLLLDIVSFPTLLAPSSAIVCLYPVPHLLRGPSVFDSACSWRHPSFPFAFDGTETSVGPPLPPAAVTEVTLYSHVPEPWQSATNSSLGSSALESARVAQAMQISSGLRPH